MQSTLLLSLRGPDTHYCPEIKKLIRWMRGLAFVPGNPDNVHEFMAPLSEVPDLKEKGPLARELEFTTQHFYSHLMHGLEVIAYRHPIRQPAEKALELFVAMCALFHLAIEPSVDFEYRLRAREDWKDGKQPASYDEFEEVMNVGAICNGCPGGLDDCYPELSGSCFIKEGVVRRAETEKERVERLK